MNELYGTSDARLCSGYALWYRDRFYASIKHDGKIREKQKSPEDQVFYFGRNKVLYDEAIHSINYLGLTLLPVGLDWIADGIGFIYAGYYGDRVNQVIYGAGFLPIISVAGVKGAKTLFKGLATGESEVVLEAGEYIIRTRRGSALANNALETITTRLGKESALAKQFEKDFAGNVAMLNKMADDPKLVEAWQLANNKLGAGTLIKKDPDVLHKLAGLLDDPVTLERMGGKEGLADILAAYKGKCRTCGDMGYKHLKNIDEYLDEVAYFATHFYNINDAKRLIQELRNGAQSTIDGGAYVVRIFKENPDGLFTSSNISAIDMRFSEDVLNRFDVKFKNGFGEFKSYRIENISTISEKQLKQYLSSPELNSLDDLSYFFDKRKLLKEYEVGTYQSVEKATIAVKEEFKTIFKNNAGSWFGVFWDNTHLRNKLFSKTNEIEGYSEFLELTSNPNSKLYNFIKVQ